MFDSYFQQFFGYPLSQYQQAEWFFASGWSLPLLALLVFLVIAAITFSLWRQPLSRPRKCALWVLQSLMVTLLLALLWKPSLRTDVVQPGDNALALLIDTSASMAYASAGTSRLAETTETLTNTGVLDELSDTFELDLQSVSSELAPIAEGTDISGLQPDGNSSNLGSAVSRTLESAAERALAGVVLISDGAATDQLPASWWQSVVSYQVPVYTIGAGQGPLVGDLALTDVYLAPVATADTQISASLDIRYDQPGDARLRVLDGETLLASTELSLPAGRKRMSGAIEFNSGELGLRDLTFELVALAGETQVANNLQRRVLQVRDAKKRILYFEGEPRWEYKFMRRAVHKSPSLELVSLLHTSPNKFYRQGVKNADELKDGFPVEREELFAYDAIIIGSVDAAMLSEEQQQNLRDFVRQRGGSLLMLAGSSGLADGGWSRSVVANALPTRLQEQVGSFQRIRAPVRITDLGLKTTWLQFATTAASNQTLWQDLPQLADIQVTGSAKAGASVLLQASVDGEDVPLLSWQRYGRGRSFVLATSGTWRWQMGLPADDQRHEKFWQGLLGELSGSALPRLDLATDKSTYRDDPRVNIELQVRADDFADTNVPEPELEITHPDGSTESVRVKADPDTLGRYVAVADVALPGEYRITSRTGSGDNLQEVHRWIVREDQSAENHALYPDDIFLQRLALETGGAFLRLNDVEQLPALLQDSRSVLHRSDVLPLWSLPVMFVLLLLLKLIEYICRWRWKRL